MYSERQRDQKTRRPVDSGTSRPGDEQAPRRITARLLRKEPVAVAGATITAAEWCKREAARITAKGTPAVVASEAGKCWVERKP